MARKRTKAELRKFRIRLLKKARKGKKMQKARASFRSVKYRRSSGHYSTNSFKKDYKRKSKQHRSRTQPTYRGDLIGRRI